jgi:hypothetical protein
VSVPFTRTLPYVLREQLYEGQQRVTLSVGEVVSVPDAAHVVVEIAGTSFTVPRLASYTGAQPGDSVYLLGSPLVMIALGTIKTAGVERELVQAEFTSDVVASSGVEIDVVSSGARTYDASPIVIEFFSPYVLFATGATNARIQLLLYDGASNLGIVGQLHGAEAGFNVAAPMLVRRRLTPTAGSHTYRIRALASFSTVTLHGRAGGAGQYVSGYIRVMNA